MTVIVFQTFAVILQTRRIQYVVTTRQNPELLLAGIDSSLVDSVVGDENVLDAISEYLGYLDLATNAGQQSLLDTFALETPHTRFHGKWLNSQHMPVSHLRSVVMSAELHKQMCVYSMVLLQCFCKTKQYLTVRLAHTIAAYQRNGSSDHFSPRCHDYSMHHCNWHATHILFRLCHRSAPCCGCKWPVPRS